MRGNSGCGLALQAWVQPGALVRSLAGYMPKHCCFTFPIIPPPPPPTHPHTHTHISERKRLIAYCNPDRSGRVWLGPSSAWPNKTWCGSDPTDFNADGSSICCDDPAAHVPPNDARGLMTPKYGTRWEISRSGALDYPDLSTNYQLPICLDDPCKQTTCKVDATHVGADQDMCVGASKQGGPPLCCTCAARSPPSHRARNDLPRFPPAATSRSP